MKRISLWFITLQLLDLSLTAYAIKHVVASEINPLGFNEQTIVIKLVAMISVFLVLQFVKLPKLAWITVWISYAVVMWNSLNILLI
jgi:hypothetical protein